MAETFCSTSALAATIPPVAAPSEDVELRLLYDPFKPETVEVHELKYRENLWLSDYLGDLPEDNEFMIFFNGEEIDETAASVTPVGRGDRIGVIVLPMGGGGLKSVLKVLMSVAMIGVMFIPGIGTIAGIALSVGLGLINAFLMTPKPPKDQGQDDRSYGIDGPKNSAAEGIPYPVVYGEFRVAGNYADTYTENVGDDQYLYLRTVLNDGEVDSVSEIEINEQPIKNFDQVSTRIKNGLLSEAANDWFRSSIRQVNKGIKLDTSWTTHVTTEPVDQLRFDVVFPGGLVDIDKKKGDKRRKSVSFDVEFREVYNDGNGNWLPVGNGTYTPLPGDGPLSDLYNEDGSTIFPHTISGGGGGGFAVQVASKVLTSKLDAAAPAPKVQYRPAGSTGAWTDAGSFKQDLEKEGYALNADNSVGLGDVTPYRTNNFTIDVPAGGDIEVRGTNGAVVERARVYPNSGSAKVTFTDSRTRAIRKTWTSARLNNGHYEARIRRTTAQSTSEYIIDEALLSDIAEIEADPVAMRGTANLSLRIKLSDQLNAIPQMTCKVRGSIVQEYDRQGNKTVRRWSANPAWIGLDILCGPERGAGLSLSRIDWPRWVEFAEYCDANSITFNGVFAEKSNVGDALRQVLRIGHAAPVPMGTRISVAIDCAREPVTMFSQASMIEKTFQVNYMSMQDRSNEFEVTYYDKSDRNKAKTIRYVDPKAVTFNEVPRTASVSLVGVDNIAQAKAELWRMIYANRLLIRNIQFETWMESINLALGEVALIQHDQMDWANSGKLHPSSTVAAPRLDQKVTMEAGQTYQLLVHYSAINRSSAPLTVSSVAGKTVLVNNTRSLASSEKTSQRFLTSNGGDYEIVKVTAGTTYHTILLAEAPTGLAAGATGSIYETDVIVERTPTAVTQNSDGTTSLTLSSSLPATPDQYANFVFGKVEKTKKPYVLTGVSGNGMEKRRLTFVEYNEGVYGAPEVDIPIPVTQVNDREVDHVRGLLFDYERLVPADLSAVNCRIYWNVGSTRTYAGADVFMRLNGASWTSVGSVQNVTEFNVTLSPFDEVEFKVIAFNARGDRAPSVEAPTVAGTLAVVFADLDAPINVTTTNVAFQVDGKVAVNFSPPADPTGIQDYEVQYKRTTDTNWTSVGYVATAPVEIPGLPTGNYKARVRASSQTSTSVWVEAAFTVAVAPGSLMENWNSSNDRNGTPVTTPTLPATDVVEHTLNQDGSANISFEWLWAGDEATIDGFEITITDTPPS